MKAVVQRRYGSADVLELQDIERPDIGVHQLLVRVAAAGVDRAAWHLMIGQPYVVRLVGFGLRAPKAPVPGVNVAGRVEAVGREVTRFEPGDDVYGTCTGAFAEYAAVSEDRLAPKPQRLSFEQAAVLPHGGLTALQALRDRGQLRAGQQVLIVGASGAVGSVAVQLAKALEADVTGVCSTSALEMVKALGADHVVDYTREDFAATGRRYDLILDTGGDSPVSKLRRALVRDGRLVIVGGEGGGRWTGVTRQLRAHLLSPFVSQKLGTFVAKSNAEDLVVLNEYVEAGQVTPIIDRAFPLSDTPAAIRALETGHGRGRIVLSVWPDIPSA
jgi:NADPH:quinone reductase-like Zn-dependent oxidoreductase